LNNKQVPNKKGFITIAIGEYYRYLALNLIKTYRLNGGKPYPFAVVSDVNTPELREHFDEVIVEENVLDDGYLYKLKLPDYTPFDETMFVDADCLVINNIDWYWEFFSDVDFGVFGRNTPADSQEPLNFFDLQKAVNEFGITNLPRFNGGIYYFMNTQRARSVFETASALIPRYDELSMPRFTNIKAGISKMGDEPLFALSMAIHNVKAVEDEEKNGMWNINGCRYMCINLDKQVCTYDKYETEVAPSLVHFGTDNTKRYHYRKEVLRLKYLESGLENSHMLRFRLALKKIVYVVRVQFFRIIMFNPSLDDLTPVHDTNERRVIRQFHKLAKFFRIKS
jgi:hypothetical protein